MVSTLSAGEEAQLAQTVEMFEIITQTQPQDYQSLEILKEAYSKLGREKNVIATAKRIAQAYVQLGQLSSAILEYETILQLYPDDPDVKAALAQIETEANNFPAQAAPTEPQVLPKTERPGQSAPKAARKASPSVMDDGRTAMHRVFVESKVITAGDFDLCWPTQDASAPPSGVIEPFIQRLADKGVLAVEKSLKLLTDKARTAYLPLEKYEVDLDLARSFPAATCRRWRVLPFDRMSKSMLVATANPFNQQAANELGEATRNRVVWYLVTPSELVKNLRKAFH
jgi:tetratricopeptide (TPR) repeat protein